MVPSFKTWIYDWLPISESLVEQNIIETLPRTVNLICQKCQVVFFLQLLLLKLFRFLASIEVKIDRFWLLQSYIFFKNLDNLVPTWNRQIKMEQKFGKCRRYRHISSFQTILLEKKELSFLQQRLESTVLSYWMTICMNNLWIWSLTGHRDWPKLRDSPFSVFVESIFKLKIFLRYRLWLFHPCVHWSLLLVVKNEILRWNRFLFFFWINLCSSPLTVRTTRQLRFLFLICKQEVQSHCISLCQNKGFKKWFQIQRLIDVNFLTWLEPVDWAIHWKNQALKFGKVGVSKLRSAVSYLFL